MKKVLALCVLLASGTAFADSYVKGYTRKDGTYVQGHYRSDANSTVTDNYSYRGNTNPYTGQIGTDRYTHDATSPYFQGPDSSGNIGHSNTFGE